MGISTITAPVPSFPSSSAPPQEIAKTINVTFSVQFDNEIEALEFAMIIIDDIKNHNVDGV